MLPVRGRPILELIIEQLAGQGFRRIYLSVNYKFEVIKEHFGDGQDFGVQIQYLHEDKPLGTGGSLGLLPQEESKPLLVMNGEMFLTKVDFKNI